jgi:hypothetical protein
MPLRLALAPHGLRLRATSAKGELLLVSAVPDESGIPSLKLSREMEKLAYEARAHIVWGKSPAAVHDEMLRCGADEETAMRVINLCMKERTEAMRQRGWRDLFIGIPLIVFCAALAQFLLNIYFDFQEAAREQVKRDWPRFEWQDAVPLIAFVLMVAFAIGCFLAVRGAQRLLSTPRPALTNKQNDPWGEGLEME